MHFRRALLAISLTSALYAATSHSREARKSPDPANAIVRRWMRTMSLRDKIAQLVVVPIYGESMNLRSAAFRRYQHEVRDLRVGGVIVTGHVLNGAVRNAEPYATAAMLNRLQKMAKLPLLVAADFERGASMRVASTTAWPYSMAFAAAKDLPGITYEGAATAREARAMGVNWLFAPVADVNNNPDNPIINIRSFGENPKEVASFVGAFIAGAHSDKANPVLVTVKHFPGHGDTAADSHVGLARLDAPLDRIEAVELEPFRAAISGGVDAVMTAHLSVPALDPVDQPATVSSRIVTGLLRTELNFHGIIVTDAMDMQGLTSMFNTAEASARAIEAGSDVLLMPGRAEEAINGVLLAVERGRIRRQQIDESVARVLQAKVQLGLSRKRAVDLERIAETVDPPEAEERAQQVTDRALTLVKDDKDTLPLRRPDRVCLIVLAENRRGQQGQKLIEEVKKRAPGMTIILVDPLTSKADLAEIGAKAAGGFSQIVVAAYVTVSAYRGNLALAGNYSDFLNGLIGGKAPVTLIAMGNPYLVRSFPNVNAYLTTYSPTPTSDISVAKALFGEIPISGRLPVSIPDIAAYGAGIQLPAVHPQ